eukprot:gene13883-20215_t
MAQEEMPAWTAIVLTCRTIAYANICRDEFKRRQLAGFIPEVTKIIAIDDPAAFSNTKNPSDANSGGIGSGGATLNAIHVVTECLSAMAGQTVVDAAHLKKAHVLVLHMTGHFTCDPLGKPFTAFAAHHESVSGHKQTVTHVDGLLNTMAALRKEAPPGVWVASTQML